MTITKVPFAILRFQYQLVRFPLHVIEERVVARMGTEAPGSAVLRAIPRRAGRDRRQCAG